jgi:hypothetical protein
MAHPYTYIQVMQIMQMYGGYYFSLLNNVIDLLSSECEVLTINPDKHLVNMLICAVIYRKRK